MGRLNKVSVHTQIQSGMVGYMYSLRNVKAKQLEAESRNAKHTQSNQKGKKYFGQVSFSSHLILPDLFNAMLFYTTKD